MIHGNLLPNVPEMSAIIYYSFAIGKRRVITENEPLTNSVQNKRNVLGVYHMLGSVVGFGDMEIGLEVTDT